MSDHKSDERRRWEEQFVHDWATKRWDKERGRSQTAIDSGNHVWLVQASVEETAAALAKHAHEWRREVLGSEVVLAEDLCFVVGMRGHTWTSVHKLTYTGFWFEWLSMLPTAREFSTAIDADVIAFDIAGTGLEYSWCRKGEALEELSWDHVKGTFRFSSTTRSAPSIEGVHHSTLLDDFLKARDACDIGLKGPYFWDNRPTKPGQTVLLENPGFGLYVQGRVVRSVPDFERVDYLTFDREPSADS